MNELEKVTANAEQKAALVKLQTALKVAYNADAIDLLLEAVHPDAINAFCDGVSAIVERMCNSNKETENHAFVSVQPCGGLLTASWRFSDGRTGTGTYSGFAEIRRHLRCLGATDVEIHRDN